MQLGQIILTEESVMQQCRGQLSMKLDDEIERIRKAFTKDVRTILLPNAPFLENEKGAYRVRPDGTKVFFPGQELFGQMVNILVLPLLMGLLTNYLYDLFSKKKSKVDDDLTVINTEINETKKQLENLKKELSQETNAFYEATDDESKDLELVKYKIAKFLESKGWPSDEAQNDANALVTKVKGEKVQRAE